MIQTLSVAALVATATAARLPQSVKEHSEQRSLSTRTLANDFTETMKGLERGMWEGYDDQAPAPQSEELCYSPEDLSIVPCPEAEAEAGLTHGEEPTDAPTMEEEVHEHTSDGVTTRYVFKYSSSDSDKEMDITGAYGMASDGPMAEGPMSMGPMGDDMISEGNEGDEGDEGNEGNEGDEGDEGNEGDEGDEGNEGNEGDEGDEGNEGNEGDEGDEGNEGNEGDEGDEGNEGDEGGSADAEPPQMGHYTMQFGASAEATVEVSEMP